MGVRAGPRRGHLGLSTLFRGVSFLAEQTRSLFCKNAQTRLKYVRKNTAAEVWGTEKERRRKRPCFILSPAKKCEETLRIGTWKTWTFCTSRRWSESKKRQSCHIWHRCKCGVMPHTLPDTDWFFYYHIERKKKKAPHLLPGEPFQEKFLGWSAFIFTTREEKLVKNVDASTGNSSVTCSGPEFGQKDKRISSYRGLNNEGIQLVKTIFFRRTVVSTGDRVSPSGLNEY